MGFGQGEPGLKMDIMGGSDSWDKGSQLWGRSQGCGSAGMWVLGFQVNPGREKVLILPAISHVFLIYRRPTDGC